MCPWVIAKHKFSSQHTLRCKGIWFLADIWFTGWHDYSRLSNRHSRTTGRLHVRRSWLDKATNMENGLEFVALK